MCGKTNSQKPHAYPFDIFSEGKDLDYEADTTDRIYYQGDLE